MQYPSFKEISVAVLGCLMVAVSPTALSAEVVPGSEQAAGLIASDQFLLRSERIDQTFLIQVARPLTPSPPDRKAPVIYATDGLLMFGLLASTSRSLPLEQLAEPAFVVAISYPEEQTEHTLTLRMRDLMHREAMHRTGRKTGGGGDAFAHFLLNELKPLIERRYPVDPARSILAGHSLGGLFAANVLANHPEAFAGYLIGSPSVHYDDYVARNVRAVGARGVARRVFIGVGELEPVMVPRADALEQALAGSRFAVARKTFANETHTSVLGAWASAGLRFLLRPRA